MKRKHNRTENKIDIVYTWVDGSDTNWLKKKNLYDDININGNTDDECRYKDNDELRFSLRSVEKYAPWINHIYIVTDNQIPKWLNTDNPKITIVDHSEIIPKECLPTFNSNGIEHCICNIKELSECFLYANDDTYFYDFVEPEFFFRKNKPICRFKNKKIKITRNLYHKTLHNSVMVLINKRYKFRIILPHHNIDAYKKSVIFKCQKEFKNEIYSTINNRFRTENDIGRFIYSYYAVATRQGIYKKTYNYDINKPFLKKFIKYLLRGSANDSKYYGITKKDIDENLKKFHPKLFCINDNENATEEDRQRNRKMLEKLFPEKSSFEK